MSNLALYSKSRNLKKDKNDTFLDFPSLSSWLDDFVLDDFPARLDSNLNTRFSLPKVNIKETTDAFVLEMAAPGFKKSDFDINLDNNVLTISSETKEENTEENENYTRREFGFTSFKRNFTLPDTVNEAKIKAQYNEGILNVYLPKREEAKQQAPKTIKIS